MNIDKKTLIELHNIVFPDEVEKVGDKKEQIQEVVENKKTLFKPNNEIQEKMGRIAIIADSSHAIGATRKGKKAGEYADFTCFSFHAVKNLTTAEGGAVTWKKNENLDDKIVWRLYGDSAGGEKRASCVV